MRKVDMIVGVRPDFIQAAALNQAFSEFHDSLDVRIIHTGQHYDPELSGELIEQLRLQPIHAFLASEGGEGLQQLASIMVSYEAQLKIDRPDLVLIIGNSNSALACSLVAAKHNVKIAHVDAGVRAYDPTVPEDQNDRLIDQLATHLLTSNEESVINLIREGADSKQIIEVGNVRSDAVFTNLGFAEDSSILDNYGLETGSYVLITLHHDHILQNVDFLIPFFTMLEALSERLRILVVLHPKTAIQLENIPELMLESSDNLQFISSQNYQDMLKLIKNTALVLTDSQGLQEETTILGVQCLTLGTVCNRPITLSRGTNTLVGLDPNEIRQKIESVMEGELQEAYPIDAWDGKASQRIAKFIAEDN